MKQLTKLGVFLKRFPLEAWVFMTLSLIVGSFFALYIPPGSTEDEPSNIFRAAGVARGALTPEVIGTGISKEGVTYNRYGVEIPTSIYRYESIAWRLRTERYCSFETPTHPGIASLDRHYLNAGCKQGSAELRQQVATLAATPVEKAVKTDAMTYGSSGYPFIAYLPAGIGMFTANALNLPTESSVHFARLGSLFAYILMTLLALYLVRRHKARWLVLAVALLPGSLVLAVTVNVDSLLLPAALVYFAGIINLLSSKKPSRAVIALVIALAILLPVLKAPYGVMSLAILFLPIFPVGKWGWIWRAGALMAIALPGILFNLSIADTDRSTSFLLSPDAERGQLAALWALQHPLDFLQKLWESFAVADWASGINTLTHQRVRLPAFVTVLSYLLISLAGLYAAQDFLKLPRIRRVLLWASLVAGILAAIAVPALTFARGHSLPAIIAAQGRYFIPFLPFIFLSIGLLLHIKLTLSPVAKWSFIGGIGLLSFLSLYWYYSLVYVWAV